MKAQLLTIALSLVMLPLAAQTDKAGIELACMNYIEGFYEGDVSKLEACLQPSLNKFGFRKDPATGEFGDPIPLSYENALKLARNVKERGNFASPDDPKIVEVIDMMEHIAVAKVTARWGVDYLLLSKRSGKWMIEQVIWEGPLKQ